MDKKTEALKLALEALEDISSHYMSLPKKGCMALAAIEEALAQPYPDNFIDALKYAVAKRDSEAQPEQEPVAWMTPTGALYRTEDVDGCFDDKHIPLYTSPPASKPLTDEEIDQLLPEIVSGGTFTVITYGRAVARAIEAAHGITGEHK